ncbi:MAG: hypothetical protein E7412_00675 [Ruminococcaceae bacterium]|nr:hypothetical protein [Oscillospiraceae bacterium]
MKNKLLIISTLLPAILLSGCYDHREIDETAYIVALGIDKGEKEGFSYTFQFSAPLAISGGEEKKSSSKDSEKKSGENSTVSTLTISAPDFYIAKNLTNNFLSKNIDMSHIKLIVFSSDISVKGIENHSQLLLREREVRPHTAIAVSAGKSSDYLEKVNPELESNTSKYYELISLRSNNAYAPTKRLHDFVDELAAKNGISVLPLAMSGDETEKLPKAPETSNWISAHKSKIDSKNSVLCGMAVFKDGRLLTATDSDSAMIFNILSRSIEDCSFTLKDKNNPQKTLTFRLIIPEKAAYTTDLNRKNIRVSQSFRVEFLGSILPEGYGSFDELYAYADSVLTKRIQSFFRDFSQAEDVDIMDIRSCTRKKFFTWNEWNSFDWESFYRQATVSVDIKLS